MNIILSNGQITNSSNRNKMILCPICKKYWTGNVPSSLFNLVHVVSTRQRRKATCPKCRKKYKIKIIPTLANPNRDGLCWRQSFKKWHN